MRDATKSLTKALPNASAQNNSDGLDIGVEVPFDNKFRLGYVRVSVPALTDHTNASVTNIFTLQDSADNSTFANTNPLIQYGVVGVATNGSALSTGKVPLPPGIQRYVRFNQTVPANGGVGNNATITYDLVT